MARKIGFLDEMASKTTGEVGYVGEVEINDRVARCCLAPADKRGDKSPDYRLMVDRAGRWVEYGAAWMKKPQAGGKDFLSITIDHESMERAVYVAAFPPSEDEDDGHWSIVWGRPRGGKARAAADNGASLDDEIPF